MKKKCKKQIKKNLEQKKVIKKKGNKVYVRRVMIIHLVAALIKKILIN